MGQRGHVVKALRGYIFERCDNVDGCRLPTPAARTVIAVVEAPPAATSQAYLPVEVCLHGIAPPHPSLIPNVSSLY